MPELKTPVVLAIYRGLTALGDLASEELPDLTKSKELGIAEGDRKKAITQRSRIRFKAALAMSKLQSIAQEYEKKANENLDKAALKKDGEKITSEVEVAGKKFSSVKLDPTKEADYRLEMAGLDEEVHTCPDLPQAFTEADFEAAMLTVPTIVLVQLGPMVKLE